MAVFWAVAPVFFMEGAPGPRLAPYDATLNGAQQIDGAVATARKEGKRVLLQFGANWCVWCVRLHTLFESDKPIAARLKQSYVVVRIDVDQGRNADVNERYGKPTRFGLPAIVVLDSDGKSLVTQDTEQLEEGDRHSPFKVLAFLDKWAPESR